MVSSGDSFQKVSGELVDLGSRLPFLYHVTCCVEVFYLVVRVEKFSSVFSCLAGCFAFCFYSVVDSSLGRWTGLLSVPV